MQNTNRMFFYESIESAVRGYRSPVQSASRLKKIMNVVKKMNSPALTMCGDASLQFLKKSMTTVLNENIHGDFLEAGVWRGGIPLLMRAFLHEQQDTSRKVWLADSFCGLPTSWKQIQNPKDRFASLLMNLFGQLAVSQKQVEDSFRRFNLLDQQVVFLPGWFNQTMPRISKEQKFSILRLDGDYYESTRDVLIHLYPLLSQNGFIIIDDYNLPFGCKKAVDEFRNQNKILSPLVRINNQSVYWRK